jgi:predicted RNA-binding protein with PIN domain
MSARLIVIDAYNVIHRAPALRPGPDRTLEESRHKLLNLLAWAYGTGDARFVVVFDGDGSDDGDETGARVEVRWARPPDKADDVIRRIVEREVDHGARVTVVTSDLEVARHARAMGADVSIADLFLASALGPGTAESEKPQQLSKREIEEWAQVFQRRPPAAAADDDELEN